MFFCWNSAQFYMWAYDGNSVSIFILLNRSSILRTKCVCPLNKDRILERHIVKANHYVCESNESSSAFSALWWYKIVTNMNVRIGGKPINYVGTQLLIHSMIRTVIPCCYSCGFRCGCKFEMKRSLAKNNRLSAGSMLTFVVVRFVLRSYTAVLITYYRASIDIDV